jgi:Fe2+ transport system protein B
MSPGQLFVYAVVTAVSFPCIATLATLTAELGRRVALLMSGATIAMALVAGGLIARVLQVA